MVGGHLAFLQIQQLFRIDLGVLFGIGTAAVADGDEREAELVELAKTKIGDVPAEHALAHLVVFMAFGLPLFGRKIAERRQEAGILFAHGLQFTERLVDLGTFHGIRLLFKSYALALDCRLAMSTAKIMIAPRTTYCA